jgi:hypothetical protein
LRNKFLTYKFLFVNLYGLKKFTMRKSILFNSFRAACLLTCAFSAADLQAQWGPTWGGNVANWNPILPPAPNAGAGNSEPALDNPTPWALGGNHTAGMPGGWAGQITNDPNQTMYKTSSIGTVNDAPFILKANNHEAIHIDAVQGKVVIGKDGASANNPGGLTAPLEIWSESNLASNRSNLRFFADKDCNIESDQHMNLIFNSTNNFNIKEGSVLSGLTSRFTVLNGGKCGINNSTPLAALDIKSGPGVNAFRIYGDVAGNVEATTWMRLHYINGYEIKEGSVAGTSTTRMALNGFGAHINTDGSLFNGLFIGPPSSTWYNNSSSHRLWIDGVANDGLAIVGGFGTTPMFVATSAGAPRFIMRIKVAQSNDNTEFDMRGSAQFGFHSTGVTWEDPNARVNVSALAMGVKITTNNNNTKAFVIQNSNFTPNASNTDNPFTVFGDGRTRIGTGFPASGGVAAGAMLSVDGLVLARDIRVAVAQGTHWADYVFDKNYKLPALSEVEKYVQENHHLPEVPSETEVIANGMDVTNMSVTLLKKVEELFLYTIDLKKQNDKLQQQVEELKAASK